jgi:hypothetical protein
MRLKQNIITVSIGVAILVVGWMTALSQDTPPKISDGVLQLHGTVQDVSTNGSALHFLFTGRLSFVFYTGVDSTRKRVALDFDTKSVPISIPNFGTAEYDSDTSYWRVSFKNAVLHASDASLSNEVVHIDLYAPKLTFGGNQTIDQIECVSCQILADRRLRELRGEHQP